MRVCLSGRKDPAVNRATNTHVRFKSHGTHNWPPLRAQTVTNSISVTMSSLATNGVRLDIRN